MNRKCNLGIDPYIKSLCLKNLGINPPVNKFEYRDQSSQVFLDMGYGFLFPNLDLTVWDTGFSLGLNGHGLLVVKK